MLVAEGTWYEVIAEIVSQLQREPSLILVDYEARPNRRFEIGVDCLLFGEMASLNEASRKDMKILLIQEHNFTLAHLRERCNIDI